jgi:pyruvate/2-oxoglutarate dehydrogenase complex dihydrolipoamide acyltransferase (E2) component
MTLSLTIDHRVIDGAPGAEFLAAIAEMFANPLALVG